MKTHDNDDSSRAFAILKRIRDLEEMNATAQQMVDAIDQSIHDAVGQALYVMSEWPLEYRTRSCAIDAARREYMPDCPAKRKEVQ